MSKKIFAIFIVFLSQLFSSCSYKSQRKKDYKYCEIVYDGLLIPVVPPKRNRKDPWDFDKLDSSFLAVIMLAMIFDVVFM